MLGGVPGRLDFAVAFDFLTLLDYELVDVLVEPASLAARVLVQTWVPVLEVDGLVLWRRRELLRGVLRRLVARPALVYRAPSLRLRGCPLPLRLRLLLRNYHRLRLSDDMCCAVKFILSLLNSQCFGDRRLLFAGLPGDQRVDMKNVEVG